MKENYKRWSWVANPFVLKIDPKLFTGYETQVKALNQHIENKHKVALISGPTGAGKTTLLRWLEINNPNTLYLAKPPQNSDGFIDIFLEKFKLGFFQRLLRKKPNLYNLPEYINNKLGKNHLIFLLDESHETNKEVLEWLRVLTDQINMTLIVAGLPSLEKNIRDNLETFDQRVTTRVSLLALDENETKELIKKRIESVGGTGLVPFTLDALDKIFRRTGGFPREVLKFCDRAVLSAIDKGIEKIDAQDIELFKEIEVPKKLEQPKVSFTPKPPSETQLKGLPYKQRKILETLSKKDWLTPTAIVDEIGTQRYKSHSHGVRSVNNILKRLLIEGYVQREAHGKGFLYALTPKVKTLFVSS